VPFVAPANGRGEVGPVALRRACIMYVYLIQSEMHPNERYVGLTIDIKQRLAAHNSGASPHTSKFPPWKLKVCLWFDDAEKAAAFEQYLKEGSGHAFARRHFW